MLLVDTEIRALCLEKRHKQLSNGKEVYLSPLIAPFSEGVQGKGVISYGLSHAGYDLRLGYKVLVFKNTYNRLVDPKMSKEEGYESELFDSMTLGGDGQRVTIPPHSYILAYSLEYICIPNMLKGRCVGKSTLARCGLIVNTTPLEPGWCGHLTIEVANVSPCPVAVYCGEGIAQLEFEVLSRKPEGNYADKQGKYQNQQAEPVPARIKE